MQTRQTDSILNFFLAASAKLESLIGLNYKIFNSIFPLYLYCLLGSTKYYHTQNLTYKLTNPHSALRQNTMYTKEWTIDMQDPGHTYFFKPKYNIHELAMTYGFVILHANPI